MNRPNAQLENAIASALEEEAPSRLVWYHLRRLPSRSGKGTGRGSEPGAMIRVVPLRMADNASVDFRISVPADGDLLVESGVRGSRQIRPDDDLDRRGLYTHWDTGGAFRWPLADPRYTDELWRYIGDYADRHLRGTK